MSSFLLVWAGGLINVPQSLIVIFLLYAMNNIHDKNKIPQRTNIYPLESWDGIFRTGSTQIKQTNQTVTVLDSSVNPTTVKFFTPYRFSEKIFPNGWVFNQNLHIHSYICQITRYFQLSPTLTKWCHIKHHHPEKFYISLEKHKKSPHFFNIMTDLHNIL